GLGHESATGGAVVAAERLRRTADRQVVDVEVGVVVRQRGGAAGVLNLPLDGVGGGARRGAPGAGVGGSPTGPGTGGVGQLQLVREEKAELDDAAEQQHHE